MVTMSASSPRFAALIAAAADAYTPSSAESPVTSAAFARLAAAMLDFAEQTSGCRVGAVEMGFHAFGDGAERGAGGGAGGLDFGELVGG